MTVIEDFESGDLSAWTDHSDGWQITTDPVWEGTYAAHGNQGGHLTSTPGDGLGDYPELGMTFDVWVYFEFTYRAAITYGHDPADPANNFYESAIYGSDNEHQYWIYENGSWVRDVRTALDASFTAGQWYNIEVTWDDPQSTTITDETGTDYGTFTMSDTRFDDLSDPGIGLWVPTDNSGDTYVFDQLRITDGLTVDVTGNVALDDGTALEGARVIGINDTQGKVEDVTQTDVNGDYTLGLTPGDTAHVVMEYDGEHGTHNAESKPFIVVSE